MQRPCAADVHMPSPSTSGRCLPPTAGLCRQPHGHGRQRRSRSASRAVRSALAADSLAMQDAVSALQHLAPLTHGPAQGCGSGCAHPAAQLVYSLADAAAAAPDAAQAAARAALPDNGWLSPISNGLDYSLHQIQGGLDALHVPYSYGWAIVCLTVGTKLLTFPFTKIQVESSLAVAKLRPTIEAIKLQYGDDRKSIQRETSALYEESGVNPSAGCLPTLATIPIFWGLYRTLSDVANAGLLTEGFYWIPSLSGPTSLAAQRAGSGIAWLYPLVDGAPPVGWDEASRYLVLPVALVAAQFASSAIISPPIKDDDQNAGFTKALFAFLPFMVGWFALNVPSGLSLYYFANTVFTSGVQIWLRKLGGAKAFEWQQEIGLNQARRTGEVADVDSLFKIALEAGDAEAGSAHANDMPVAALTNNEEVADGSLVTSNGSQAGQMDGSMVASNGSQAVEAATNGAHQAAGSLRAKRKRRALLEQQPEGSEVMA